MKYMYHCMYLCFEVFGNELPLPGIVIRLADQLDKPLHSTVPETIKENEKNWINISAIPSNSLTCTPLSVIKTLCMDPAIYVKKKKKRVLYIKLLHERRIPPLIRTLQELKQPHQRFSSRENTGN